MRTQNKHSHKLVINSICWLYPKNFSFKPPCFIWPWNSFRIYILSLSRLDRLKFHSGKAESSNHYLSRVFQSKINGEMIWSIGTLVTVSKFFTSTVGVTIIIWFNLTALQASGSGGGVCWERSPLLSAHRVKREKIMLF